MLWKKCLSSFTCQEKFYCHFSQKLEKSSQEIIVVKSERKKLLIQIKLREKSWIIFSSDFVMKKLSLGGVFNRWWMTQNCESAYVETSIGQRKKSVNLFSLSFNSVLFRVCRRKPVNHLYHSLPIISTRGLGLT